MAEPASATRVVKGACPHDCPDTCALETTVENGVAIKVAGAKDHPWTDGALCTKVSRYLDRTYAADRVVHPHRRVGGKGPGNGAWERITWHEALATIAEKFTAIAASPDGPEGICPYSYAGTMGLLNFAGMDRRFFNHLGASLLDRTLCSSAGKVGIKLTLGGSVGMDPERVEDSHLILIWGSNPITSNLHYWVRVQEAKRRGAKVVVIDPYRSLTAEKGTEHVPVRPGTDAALALAMMHVIINEGRHDADYVARYTVGFEALRDRVQEYPPERAAEICGIPAETIVGLAREYATTSPATIRVNYGLQRHKGGGAAVRAITCLPALIGSWRQAAGGVLLSTGDFYGMNTAALERTDLLNGRRPRTINTSSIGDALLEAVPPIKALFVYNSNPVTVAPDSEKVVRGFSRPDLFTVVHDVFFTDTADYADIFLPATTQLECLDLHKSYGHLYVLLNQPAIAPVGESLPNTEVFRRIAKAMGLTEPALFESDETLIRQTLSTSDPRMAGITFERLLETGWQRLDVPATFTPFAEDLVDVRWDDGHDALVTWQDRAQVRMVTTRLAADAATVQVLAEVTGQPWVEPVPGVPCWAGDALVTVQDRLDLGPEGTRAVVVDGQPLSPPGLQVRRVLHADADRLVVAASHGDATSIGVYEVGVATGDVTPVLDVPGIHAASVGGTTRVEVSATMAGPATTAVVTPDARRPLPDRALDPGLDVDVTFHRLGPHDLHAGLLVPPGDGPFPVLLDPYGGPHAQRVVRSRNAWLVSSWFAAHGYAVLVVDGRGTPGRSPTFEHAIHGRLAEVVLDDQVDALHSLAEVDPRLDLDRVAIRGWSFGGFLAGLAALRRPDVVRAAIVGAPNARQDLYDTHYSERYLGHPDDTSDAYRASSLVDGDGELVAAVDPPDGHGPPRMLVIHGLVDDNVLAAHSLELSRALLAAGRPHEFLPLSGVTHITPQEEVSANLLRLQLDFLDRSLAPRR